MKPLPPLIKYNESDLFRLSPDELITVLVECRDAGQLDLAATCAQLFAFGLQKDLTNWFRRRNRSLSDEQIDDLVAQTIVRVVESTLRSGSQFRGSSIGELRKWIYTIAKYTGVDFLRSKEQKKEVDSLQDGLEPLSSNDGFEISDEEEGYVQFEWRLIREELLSQLSPDHQEVVMLAVYQDLPSAQVADMTGQSVANVDKIKSRYRADLRSALEATDSGSGSAAEGESNHSPTNDGSTGNS
ncbi:MAG: RNA polymerase sigma factor [Solirubrobacterales bacterium]|nr:RNA polymerase sigma factor [Solirubrobacterales bacterium]